MASQTAKTHEQVIKNKSRRPGYSAPEASIEGLDFLGVDDDAGVIRPRKVPAHDVKMTADELDMVIELVKGMV